MRTIVTLPMPMVAGWIARHTDRLGAAAMTMGQAVLW